MIAESFFLVGGLLFAFGAYGFGRFGSDAGFLFAALGAALMTAGALAI